jgi:quercetin dioxygenase-like cupin family protein
MKLLVVALGLAVAAPAAAEPAKATSTALQFDRTLTGQPVTLPQGPVTVEMRVSEFPAGFKGPLHKQPYARLAYILAGRLRVHYEVGGVTKEFGPGEAMVEGIDQWHWVEPIGPEGVKVLVIDQTPPGVANVVIRPKGQGD